MGTGMNREKSFSGFLGETFDLVGQNAVPILLFVLVLGVLNTVGLMLGYVDPDGTFASLGFGFNIDPAVGWIAGLYQILAAVLSVVASYFLLARFLESRGRLPVRDTRIWAYVGITIVSVMGMIFGFLLFVVPGVILLVRWSASSGYLLEGRLGIIDSLKASWEATRGHSWPIFFAGLVLFLGLGLASGIVGSAIDFTGSALMVALFSSMMEMAGNALGLAFGIAVYLLVADNSNEISEVFA